MATLTLERRRDGELRPPEAPAEMGLVIRPDSADLSTPPVPILPTHAQLIDAAAFLRDRPVGGESLSPEHFLPVSSLFRLAAAALNGEPTQINSEAWEQVKQGWICLAWAGSLKTITIITEPTFYSRRAQNEALARHQEVLVNSPGDPSPPDPDAVQTTADLCRLLADLQLICPPGHLAVTSSQLGESDFTDNWPEGSKILWHLVSHAAEDLTPEAIQAHRRFWQKCLAIHSSPRVEVIYLN
jgi:hypothetical protein